jgi:diaminopimelate epimerase
MSPRIGVACEIWSGAGNDFVIVEAARLPARTARAALARYACGGACHRRVDGLILVGGRQAELWNRDGSHPAFCGNGARCFAARVLDVAATTRVRLRFGRVPLVAWRAGREIAIRVPTPRRRRGRPDAETIAAALGRAAAQVREASRVDAGVPHLCLRLARGRGRAALRPGQRERLRTIGARLRRSRAFGEAGTNVTFIWEPVGPGKAYEIRTYERGVEDLTRACGSGALAAGRTLMPRARAQKVELRVASGARLTVQRTGAGWVLRGPARRIKRGRLVLPAPAAIRLAARGRRPGG